MGQLFSCLNMYNYKFVYYKEMLLVLKWAAHPNITIQSSSTDHDADGNVRKKILL